MLAVRSLYLRGIALCHLLALLSFWVQAEALVGDGGITPLSRYLPAILAGRGPLAHLQLPSLLWLWPDMAAVHLLLLVGVGLSVALLVGSVGVGIVWEGPVVVALWAIYLSLCSVSDVFLGYQWDSLLVEATFCAAFVARWHPQTGEPPRWAWWVQWWLLFRLMFFAGYVKWTSGDPSWPQLTALDVHFWTQPLPGPLSRWAHHWPAWLHALGVMFTLLVELVVPFAIPFGRQARLLAASLFSALMLALALTGNYGFFQLLTVVLCLSLLDDRHLPRWLRERLTPASVGSPGWHLGLPLASLWFLVSLLWGVGYEELPPAGQRTLQALYPFRTVNPYGLFAVMTTDRLEIVLEGSDDGQRWRELHTRFKPGPLDRVPPQVAPHMPRVDWQLWFAALGSCRENPWLIRLMMQVADGSRAIEGLFLPGTFEQGHPQKVRAVIYRYTFAAPGSEAVWERELLGPYCPTVERRPTMAPRSP
jgi:hypothetical protein